VFFAAFAALFLILWGILHFALPFLRRIGTMLTRRLARLAARSATIGRWTGYAQKRLSRFRVYLPIAVIIVCGAALTAWAGDGFLDLAELVHQNSPLLQQVDANVHDWAVSRRNGQATQFFMMMTIAGGPAGLAVIVFIAAIALIVRRRWRWLAYLAITCGGGALLNLELKRFFARARPDVAEMLRLSHGYSFPSGHAMGATVTFGALAYLAFRAKTWRWKSAALALAMTFATAVALSRVYLGAHWISDVGAGIAAGTIWVSSTTVAYETFRRMRLLRAARRAV
jgi:undecaprenyl-diphosphatase